MTDVQEIAAGAGSSLPGFFTAVGPLVFFSASDNMTGNELWAISRSAFHRDLNVPETTAGLGASDEPSRPRAAANEFRAFLPVEDDPRDLAASEGATP